MEEKSREKKSIENVYFKFHNLLAWRGNRCDYVSFAEAGPAGKNISFIIKVF